MIRKRSLIDTVNTVNVNLLVACFLTYLFLKVFNLSGWSAIFVIYAVVATGQWLNKKTLMG